MPMDYNFDECRNILLECLVEALKANRDAIREITKDQNETGWIDAISYDVLPWHRFACVSFRIQNDYALHTGANYDQQRAKQYSPADWKYYDFIDDATLEPVRQYTGDLWALASELEQGRETSDDGRETQHVIQLAAAYALLDQRVVNLLERFGLNAEPPRDQFPRRRFEYLVRDEDQTFNANYCEFVIFHRVTRRLLGCVPE